MINALKTFLCYASIWIAICAYSLCIVTLLSFDKTLEEALLHPSSFIVLGGTLVIYSIHNLYKSAQSEINYTSRQQWSKKHKGIIICLLALGVSLCLYHLPHLAIESILVVSILGVISAIYTLPLWIGKIHIMPLRQYGLLKPFILASVWIGVSVLFPLTMVDFSWHDISNSSITEWLYRCYLMTVLCILFDIKDIAHDTKKGILTIASRYKSRLPNILNAINICTTILIIIVYINQQDILLMPYLIASCFLSYVIALSNHRKNELFFVWNVDGVIFIYSLVIIIWR